LVIQSPPNNENCFLHFINQFDGSNNNNNNVTQQGTNIIKTSIKTTSKEESKQEFHNHGHHNPIPPSSPNESDVNNEEFQGINKLLSLSDNSIKLTPITNFN